MIEMFAGVAVCGVSVLYLSTVVAVMTGQRESDRLELHGLIADLRADLDALLKHLGLEITAGWPEQEPAPVDDTPTGPIMQPVRSVVLTPNTAPLERVWDEAVAELVAQEPRTVTKTINGFTFRIREDAA